MSAIKAILIIEDDLVDQMAFSRSLTKHFPAVEIIIAETIKAGIQQMKQRHFDWVISDFNLPDGTVMDILQFAKSNKMVCISGETEASKIQLLLDRGFQQFLLKDQHLNYVNECLNLIRQTQEHSISKKSSSAPPFSLDLLIDKFDGDEAVIKDILHIFQENGATDLQQLQAAIAEKDSEKSNHLAHRIKSGYRVIGLNAAFELLEEIETQSITPQVKWNTLSNDLQKVNSIFANFHEMIPTLLANLSSNA